MSYDDYDALIKLLMIGDSSARLLISTENSSGVGKGSLMGRFANPESDHIVSAVGIGFKERTIDLDGKRIKLQIWDAAGQERYQSITTAYYRGAMGFVVVYDITDELSLSSVPNWMENIEMHAREQVSKILVGNKCHLEDARVVSADRGREMAREYGMPFVEASADTGMNVELVFLTLARDIVSRSHE